MKREIRECQDGSSTFYLAEADECYHAPVGAALESREKYAHACGLEKRAQKGFVKILDVCYGLGYNTAAALEVIWKTNPECKVEVVGLEIDKSIIIDRQLIDFPFDYQEVFDTLATGFDEKTQSFGYKDDKLTMKVVIGDAKETVKYLAQNHYDVIFFDPFSPGKHPHMWTQEFIQDVFDCSAKDSVLVTYSCARKVRERLAEAGFVVSDGPVVGRRGPATLATKAS